MTSTPDISLVHDANGGVTLLIDGVQAMQGWEAELMWRSADLLCADGGDFLEVGLGLGYSALRIAGHPGTRRHTVIEKHADVIDLFRTGHPTVPGNLEILHADFFDHLERLPQAAYDGIFFDPELPRDLFEDRALLDEFMPRLINALRPGGRFVPMFALDGAVPDAATCTTTPAAMLDRYLRYFDRVEMVRHPYRAYVGTEYTPSDSGDAFILCFGRA